MEDWLGLTFRPLLAQYVANYSKERLSLSFLKGKGTMRDVVLNVAEVNALPAVQTSPFRLAHAAMDHVHFKASLTRLRTKPVSVHVGRLDIDLYERPPHEAAAASVVALHATQPAPSEPAAPRAYKLTDRIMDGVRVEIGEVRIRLRTLGRRKCPRVGPWSPPDGLWVLRGVRLATVDEEGLEVSDLEEAWAYNKARLKKKRRARRACGGAGIEEEKEDDYFLFKRLLVESLAFYALPRRPAAHRFSQAGGGGGHEGDGPRLLVPETPVECRFTIRRPLQDVARWLGFEMDLRLDRFRLHLPQGGGQHQEEEQAYAQWVSFFLGFYSCLAGRHAWAAAAAEGTGAEPEEDEDLLLLEGLQGRGSESSVAGAPARPMSAMYGPSLDGSGGGAGGGGGGQDMLLRSAASSVGPESEEEEEDEEEDEKEGSTVVGGPPDFLTDEDGASLMFPEGASTTASLQPSSSSVSDGKPPAAPSALSSLAAARDAAAPAAPTMRTALVLSLPFVEVKLLDRDHDQTNQDADAVRGWALAMHNVRIESIRGGSGLGSIHASENVCQAHFGHFELRALNADGEPLPGRPALLRPMLQDPALSAASEFGHFPKMVPRGVRDDEEDEEAAAETVGAGGEEAATAGDGASLLLRHHLRTDALAVKLHTFVYPAPPPPQVAGNLEARFSRRLHLVADLSAWRGLAAFLARHTDQRCLTGEWGDTLAQEYSLQPMPSGGVRNMTLRAAGLAVRLPSSSSTEGGRGFTLACGASSLVVSPALPRSFLDAPAAADGEAPTALDARLVAAAATAHVMPAVVGAGATGAQMALAPWRMQLTLGDVRLLASVTAGEDEKEREERSLALLDPVGIHLLVSIDDGAATAATCRIVDGRTFYVPLDEASSLSVSLACLGRLRARLQPQAWLALAETVRGPHTTISQNPTTAAPASRRWPAGAILAALRLPELFIEVPSPSPLAPALCIASIHNLQYVAGTISADDRSALAWFVEGARVEVCGHSVLEMVTAAGDDYEGATAAAMGTVQQTGAAAVDLEARLPAVQLHVPLAAEDLERVVDTWTTTLCAPTGLRLLPPLGGETQRRYCPRFPSGSIGALLLQQAVVGKKATQQARPPTTYAYALRLHIARASAAAALADGRALQAEALGLLVESTPATSNTCTWVCVSPAVGLALLQGAQAVAVLPETGLQLEATSAGGRWAAEVVVGATGKGLHASVSSDLAEALGVVQQRLSGLASRLGVMEAGEQAEPLTAAQQALGARLVAATHAVQASLAAARQAVGAAAVAHAEGQQRARAREAGLAAALAGKELQRRHLAALHHADHAGFLHVGTLTASATPAVPAAAEEGRQEGSGAAVRSSAKAKALIALPRRWCVLRGDVLLVYDHPHSFHLERALPLRPQQHGSAGLREVALADARSSQHHRRVYALVCGKGDATAAGLPVFLACEAGAEAAAWRAALRPFLDDPPHQQSASSSAAATTPPPKRRFPLLTSPRSASGSHHGGATAATPISSAPGGRPPSAKGAPSPASSSFKPPSVFTRRTKATTAAVGTPVTTEVAPSFLLLSTPGSTVTAAAPPVSCDDLASATPMAPFVSVSATPSLATASYTLTIGAGALLLGAAHDTATAAANNEPSSRAASPLQPQQPPAPVTRTWSEIVAFHHDYLPRWLQATKRQHKCEHAPTGMGPEEAMAYADKLLRGSHALLHAPASPSEAARGREQARILALYLQLVLAACPQQQEEGEADCRAALQRFLGLASLPTAMPAGEKEDAPPQDTVTAALQTADARLRRAEAGVLRMQLTGALQAAVAADRERAAVAERLALAQRVEALEAALAAERARAAALEGAVGQAVLARDDAVQAMTEVSTDSARKLMIGELRYLSLLKKAHPRAHAAELEGHSRRHSHHHATKPTAPSPPPPPSSLSAASASPPPPPPQILTRAGSSGVGCGAGSLSPRNSATATATVRRLSSGGGGFSSLEESTGGAATTAQQRREQLEQLLRQTTPPPRSPRSLTPPPPSQMLAEGMVTRAHHTEVVYRLKALLAAREEEARALWEALGLAQEEAEGRAHRARLWRLGEEEEDDGLFDSWRARVAAERAGRAKAEAGWAASRAQWAGLVEGLAERKEDVDVDVDVVDVEEEWVGAWREYHDLVGLATGACVNE